MTGFSRRDSIYRGGGMLPLLVKGRLPDRAEEVPLEFVRAMDAPGAEHWDRVLGRWPSWRVRSYMSD